MHITKHHLLGITVFIFLIIAAPGFASAGTLLTVSNTCSATTPTPCYTTISGAITAANPTTTGDTIQVLPGTYVESITLDATVNPRNDNLPITGIEASRTVIRNPGTGAVINANNLTSFTLTKVTIDIGTGTGIQALNSTLSVSNNIFRGNGGTAISVQNTTRTNGTIDHNAFFHYQTAISSNIDLIITNNIFYGNGSSIALAAVSGGPVAFTQFASVNNNDFFQNQIPASGFLFEDQSQPTFIAHSSNIPNLSIQDPDPLFVDPTDTDQTRLDYHVQEGSPTLGTGTGQSDMGAFGGSGADTIPFPVVATVVGNPADQTQATVSWTPNLASNITNSVSPGSYEVTYALNSGATTTAGPFSAPTTSTLITGLTATSSPPGAPTLFVTGYSDQTLYLGWYAGTNATGYIVNFVESGGTNTQSVDVHNVISYALTGLVNGQHYDVWITPYAQATYNFSVFVRDNSSGPFEPGVQHESVSSPSRSLTLGPRVNGPDSNTVANVFPEKIQAKPDLTNSGCFIATAAYGYYSAPQVQILRDFRDHYLLTNRPGRAFVDWYYHYGPIGAAYINAHPWIKPVVRAALLPLIAAAFFMLETSLAVKLVTLLGFCLISGFLFMRRRNLARSGGAR